MRAVDTALDVTSSGSSEHCSVPERARAAGQSGDSEAASHHRSQLILST